MKYDEKVIMVTKEGIKGHIGIGYFSNKRCAVIYPIQFDEIGMYHVFESTIDMNIENGNYTFITE